MRYPDKGRSTISGNIKMNIIGYGRSISCSLFNGIPQGAGTGIIGISNDKRIGEYGWVN